MNPAASRSRYLELLEARTAARRGRDLLDEKREILLHELARRSKFERAAREKAAAALRPAREALAEAQVEIGAAAVEAAALAQEPAASVAAVETRILGVAVPSVRLVQKAWSIRFAPGGTCESLDRAANAFAAALAPLTLLAQAEREQRLLARALARTTRRLNALEQVVLPELESEIQNISAAMEEEERDEAFRRKRWFRARAR